METEIGISRVALGNIETCFLASYAIGQFFIPTLMTGLNIKEEQGILIMYCGAGLSSIFFGLSSSSFNYNALWIFNGLLNAGVFPLMATEVNKHFNKKNRGKIMGAWTTSQQVGAIASTTFSSYIAGAFGWRQVFYASGLYATIIGIIYYVYITLANRRVANINRIAVEKEVTNINGDTNNGSISEIVKILLTGDIFFSGLSYFFVKFIRYSLLFWLPYYFSDHLKFESKHAGYISVIFDVGGVIGGITAGQIADRFFKGKRMLIALVSGLLSSILIFAYAMHISDSVIPNLVFMGLVGVMIAAGDSIIGATTANDVCERKSIKSISVVSGVINGFGAVGAILQGSFTTFTTEKWGWTTYYYLLSLAGFLGFLALIVPAIHETFSQTPKNSSMLQIEIDT